MSARNAVAAVLAVLLAVVVSGCGSSAGTSQSGSGAAPAQLGEQIFTTGNGASGYPLGVSSGPGGPCARCHGTDAKGAVGPDIRWSVLTGSASSSHPPRFKLASEADFVTAITTGEAAGNQLLPRMPHYQLTPTEAAALAAYLKTL